MNTAIQSILSSSKQKIQKILLLFFSSSQTPIPPSLEHTISNFSHNSFFLNNTTYSPVNIHISPGYIQALQGFVPIELTNFITSLGIKRIIASSLSAKFLIWFTSQGHKKIWLTRCQEQIATEKTNSIFTKHKRTPRLRSGRPVASYSSVPYNTLIKTHMNPNLCLCKFPASAHINNQCLNEGLSKIHGDLAVSAITTLKAENDLFFNPLDFT